jgi:hypothetical protein
MDGRGHAARLRWASPCARAGRRVREASCKVCERVRGRSVVPCIPCIAGEQGGPMCAIYCVSARRARTVMAKSTPSVAIFVNSISGGSSKAEPPTFDAQPRRRPKQLVGPQVWAPRRAAFERATKRTVPPATIPPRLASPWLTRSLPLRRSPIAACVPAHLVDTPARSLQQRCATGAGSRPSGASQTRAKRRLTACERGRAPFPPRNLRPRGSGPPRLLLA